MGVHLRRSQVAICWSGGGIAHGELRSTLSRVGSCRCQASLTSCVQETNDKNGNRNNFAIFAGSSIT